MSKRIWIVIGLGLIVLLIAGLVIFLIVVPPKTSVNTVKDRLPVARVLDVDDGQDMYYWINDQRYNITMYRETGPVQPAYASWLPRKADRPVYWIHWTDTDEVSGELYSLQGDEDAVGLHLIHRGHTLYPADLAFPSFEEIVPNRMSLGLYQWDMRQSWESYVLDDVEWIDQLNAICHGGDAPVYMYTAKDFRQLRQLVEDNPYLYLATQQVPGSVYRVPGKYNIKDLEMMQTLTDEERAAQYPMFYVALQIIKHGVRVR